MVGPRRMKQLPLLITALSGIAAPAAAQQVAEIQVLPPDLTLLVDSSDLVIAQVFDARGGNIPGAQIRWLSSNVNVARVVPDAGQPTATVFGVAEGIAQIEARVGNVSSIVVVQVILALPEAQPVGPAAAIRLDSLPNEVDAASRQLIARIEPHNFGFPQPCRVGGFIESNLLLTSYTAIRGADSVSVILAGGTRVTTGVLVAAHDVQADLAVLHIPTQRTGELTIGENPSEGDYVWVVGQRACLSTETARSRVEDTAPGLITLEDEMGLGQLGAPVINRDGEIVGVANGGAGAVRASTVRTMDVEARRNVASGNLLTLLQVARAEQHAYGSLVFQSNLARAVARIRPIENWHWPELAEGNTLPMTFVGPMGRYEVELLMNGAVQSTTTVTIQPGVANQLLLTPTVVAGGPQPQPVDPDGQIAAPQGGGGFPVAVVLLGLVAAGGGAFLLMPKDAEPGPGGGGGGTGVTTGTIVIRIPVHN